MGKRVLICDDAAFMRMMIKDILTKNGYEIAAEAENGQKAVEKYPEAKPDLVLMDITMPDMDGIEAVKQIKAFGTLIRLITRKSIMFIILVFVAIIMTKIMVRKNGIGLLCLELMLIQIFLKKL